jgi:hypothetical protein
MFKAAKQKAKWLLLFCLWINLISPQEIDSLNQIRILPKQLLELKTEIQINRDFDKPPYPPVNKSILLSTAVLSVVVGTPLIVAQTNNYWKGRSTNFHFAESNNSAWIKRFSKFYSTNFIAHFYSASLESANMDYELATIYSAAIALSYNSLIEGIDGFTRDEGFDASGYLFNIIGAGYVLGQYYIPTLKHFQPKFSYSLDKINKNNELSFGEDYSGHIYWLGVRVKELLPEKVAKFWPSFLMLSFGIGTNSSISGNVINNEYYIALDFDAETLPLNGRFWQFIKNTLNYFHFPLPGIRVSPDMKFIAFTF